MTLTRMDVWRVFWRSLFIQAGFNPDSMQALGLVYALDPALRRLYPDAAQRQTVVKQYLGTFNTHPYVSAAIVGGMLFHEQRFISGQGAGDRAEHLKRSLMGPLAALGDGFFWRSLVPAVGALSATLVPLLGAWSVVVFLTLYNVIHLTARARLFWLGYTYGDGLLAKVAELRAPKWGERLRAVAAAASGGMGGFFAMRVAAERGGAWTIPIAVSGVVGCVAVSALVQQGRSRYLLLYALALGAIVLGALTQP